LIATILDEMGTTKTHLHPSHDNSFAAEAARAARAAAAL